MASLSSVSAEQLSLAAYNKAQVKKVLDANVESTAANLPKVTYYVHCNDLDHRIELFAIVLFAGPLKQSRSIWNKLNLLSPDGYSIYKDYDSVQGRTFTILAEDLDKRNDFDFLAKGVEEIFLKKGRENPSV